VRALTATDHCANNRCLKPSYSCVPKRIGDRASPQKLASEMDAASSVSRSRSLTMPIRARLTYCCRRHSHRRGFNVYATNPDRNAKVPRGEQSCARPPGHQRHAERVIADTLIFTSQPCGLGVRLSVQDFRVTHGVGRNITQTLRARALTILAVRYPARCALTPTQVGARCRFPCRVTGTLPWRLSPR